MNPKIKAKWVAALRSGEYAQTKQHLQDKNGYCCLGVLCVMSEQENGFGITENHYENGDDEDICISIQQWAELPSSSGAIVTIEGKRTSLTAHNDEGKTFLQIADAIEVEL